MFLGQFRFSAQESDMENYRLETKRANKFQRRQKRNSGKQIIIGTGSSEKINLVEMTNDNLKYGILFSMVLIY